MKKSLQKINKKYSRKKFFNSVLSGICFSFLLYGFGITGTTLSVADAKSSDRQALELQTEIAELEIEYFEIVNTLSLEEAAVLGMKEQEDIIYARVDQKRSIAYNN